MWIMPTMNRPDRCQAALKTMIAAGIATPGVVIVNGSLQKSAYLSLKLPRNWDLITLDENRGLCGALQLAQKIFPEEPWYGLVCDDEHVFTHGFDRTIIEAAGEWNIAHGNDNWRSEYRLWTYVVWGGQLIRECGYWALPGLWHWYFDDHWELIAKEFGLKRWCQDVKTQHVHVDAGTAPDDLTYQTGRSRNAQDKTRFEQWKRAEWPGLKIKLRDRIKASCPATPDGLQ